MNFWHHLRLGLLASPFMLLAACGGNGGGGGGQATAAPSRVLFQENTAEANIYSVQLDGAGIATISDALDNKHVASGYGSLESQVIENLYTSPYTLNYKPLVLNGRVVYQQKYTNGFQDIYASGLDGTARVALAATTDMETPIALVGNRLIYASYKSTGGTSNVHSVLLDGTGDVALTSGSTTGFNGVVVAHIGGKLIYVDPDGTHIVQPDGTGKVTLWDKQAAKAIANGAQLLLTDNSEVVAVNVDGSGFISLATGIDGNGISIGLGSGDSHSWGIAGDRVFYHTLDSSVTPWILRLHTVGLDRSNHLVVAESTTAYPHVMDVVGDKLIVQEATDSNRNVVAYDPATANSRQVLLAGGVYMFHSGNRVVGYVNQSGQYLGPWVVNAVNMDGSVATQLTQAISNLNSFQLVLTDGNRIVYGKTGSGSQVEGYSVKLDGTDTKQITTGAGDKELVALIGSKLVYQSYETGNTGAARNLHGVMLDGSGAVDYATTSADDRYLGQSSDQLIFTSTDAGTVSMNRVPAGGGAPVLLLSSSSAKQFWGLF